MPGIRSQQMVDLRFRERLPESYRKDTLQWRRALPFILNPVRIWFIVFVRGQVIFVKGCGLMTCVGIGAGIQDAGNYFLTLRQIGYCVRTVRQKQLLRGNYPLRN